MQLLDNKAPHSTLFELSTKIDEKTAFYKYTRNKSTTATAFI